MSKTRKKFLFRGALVAGLVAVIVGAMLSPSFGGGSFFITDFTARGPGLFALGAHLSRCTERVLKAIELAVEQADWT